MTLSILLLAAGLPFLWALVNHADKYLIDKFSGEREGGGIGGLMIFSMLFPPGLAAVLMCLCALNEDETAVMASFMQLLSPEAHRVGMIQAVAGSMRAP